MSNNVDFNETKSLLTTTLQSFSLSEEKINEMLSDNFINGLIELQQQEPENNEFLNLVRNFSNEQNLHSVRQLEKEFRSELSYDGYVCDIFRYIKEAWINITFPEDTQTRSIANVAQRVSSIIGSGLTAIANSPTTNMYFLASDFSSFVEMSRWANDKQNEYYNIVDNMSEELWRTANGLKATIASAEANPSPLILDLDGDGIETSNLQNGVHFDHDNNGFSENTGWVAKDDGLLVRDLNNNAQIDNGTELFGDQTLLSNGEKAANGFEALKDLDSNNDGIFNSSDTTWNQVKVWKDTNQNGRVDQNELLSLELANVASINLNYSTSLTSNFLPACA